ncbi:MAG: hypothetical protein WBJ10_12530 [Daejeonella sp.]|uniref:hypothetical protein n=1 Tax=Daejeonella sp. TaxID=2805397 RepID=UPI003C7389A2
MYNRFLKNPLGNGGISSITGILTLSIVGFIGYKIYNIFSNPVAQAERKQNVQAEKQVVAQTVSTEHSQASQVKHEKDNLAKQNIPITGTSHGIANQIHSLIDSHSVDEQKIISIVKRVKLPNDIRALKVAYGMRELKNWGTLNSLQSIFTVEGWKNILHGKNFLADLPSHLRIVLNDSELKQIETQLKYM